MFEILAKFALQHFREMYFRFILPDTVKKSNNLY